MKKKKYIKVIAFLVIMTMSVLFCSKAIYEKDKTAPRPNKIDESLWNYMQKAESDELIPIYLSITPISEVAVSDTLKEKTGLDSSLFNDDDRFKKEIETEIKNTLKNTKNKDTLVKELKKNFPEFKIDYNNIFESKKEESVENVTKSIILEIRKYYQSEKNKIYSSLQSAENQKFINEYVISRNSEIEFVSKYTAGMLVKANVGDIKYYSTLSEVIVISYNDPNFVAEESLAYISSQVGFDSENGTKSSSFNSGTGFYGEGINIGVIEAQGIIDVNSPHYDSNRMIGVSNNGLLMTTDTHASLVTSIVAGNRVFFPK